MSSTAPKIIGQIRLEKAEGFAKIILDNERKWNAFSLEMLEQLDDHLAVLEKDMSLRAIIITGVGERAFCCGADIGDWSKLSAFEFARLWVKSGHRVFDRLARMAAPTIAAINGHAFGGGLELAASCDIRLLAPGAQLALPEAGVGIVPGWSGTQRLAHQFPQSAINEMALFGRKLTAERAFQLGFANGIYEDVVAEAESWIAEAAGLAPRSVEVNKLLIGAAFGEAPEAVLETLAGGLIAASEDKAEGVAAFFEKRSSQFKGQ